MSHPFYIKARLFFSLALLLLNPLMPGSNKRSYILKETCSFWLQVFLSVYDLLLPLGIKRLKFSNLQSKMLPKCFFINFACKTVILKLAPDLTVGFIYLNEIHFKSSIQVFVLNFSQIEKQLEKKVEVHLKNYYDVTGQKASNYSIDIAQYFKK